MHSHKLPNYVRSHRKRAGLFQHEVAFLLGSRSNSRLSRCEHFRSVPGFRTTLALLVIFHASPRDIFSGEYHRINQAVRRRAKRLSARLQASGTHPQTARKLAFLQTIIGDAAAEHQAP